MRCDARACLTTTAIASSRSVASRSMREVSLASTSGSSERCNDRGCNAQRSAHTRRATANIRLQHASAQRALSVGLRGHRRSTASMPKGHNDINSERAQWHRRRKGEKWHRRRRGTVAPMPTYVRRSRRRLSAACVGYRSLAPVHARVRRLHARTRTHARILSRERARTDSVHTRAQAALCKRALQHGPQNPGPMQPLK